MTFVRTGRMDRLELADEPRLGGGSLLEYALAVSSDPHAPFLFSERPLLDLEGQRRTRFTLVELDGIAQAWSCWYLKRGIGPRDRVAVYIEDSFEDVLHYLALTQVGAIPVLINGALDGGLAADLCRRTGAVGLYTDSLRVAAFGEFDDLRLLAVADQIAEIRQGSLTEEDRYLHGPHDPVLISHSSGTTGAPKAVVWTHEASVAGIRELLRQPSWEGSVLSAVPQSHQAGPSFAAGALLFGCPLIALADRSGNNVAASIARHRPTTVAAFSQTYAELAAFDPDPALFSSVERWFNTGDSAHGRHIAPLVRAGRRMVDGVERAGSEFIDGLGSSELGFAQFYQVATTETIRHDRCIGRPQPFAEVAVLRPDGNSADVGEVGMLGVKSPTVTPGYWNDSDLTYRSWLRGYFLSGDLVYQDEEGQYFHMGTVRWM
jgi:acyl-coenzyme A synthetase/AMP-(fatty) acid ligase